MGDFHRLLVFETGVSFYVGKGELLSVFVGLRYWGIHHANNMEQIAFLKNENYRPRHFFRRKVTISTSLSCIEKA